MQKFRAQYVFLFPKMIILHVKPCVAVLSATSSHTHALQIKPLFNSFLLSLLSAYMSAFRNVLIIVLCIVLCCHDPFKYVKLLLSGCLTRITYSQYSGKQLQTFVLDMLRWYTMDRLTTGCDGNSLTDAVHFWCFIIFLKSMQSRRFAPLFANL